VDGAVRSSFDRAIAFIDATFALALTLLVTSLEIDDQYRHRVCHTT
jgi:hypothetical protein